MGGVTRKLLPKENNNAYPEGETRGRTVIHCQGCGRQRNGYLCMIFLKVFEEKD